MAKFSESHVLVRIGALSEIDKTLSELGVDPEPVLAAHGLSSKMLEEGDSLVPVEQAAALLEQAAILTACPHFAIELASRQSVNLLGAIGLLVQTADTVREALQDVERYLRTTHVSHIQWTLVRRGEFDAFEVSVDLPTITSDQIRLINELGVAQCYRIMQSVSMGQLDIASVCFRHGKDPSLSLLRRFFKAPVHIAADFDGLLFAPGAIDLKVSRADSQTHQSLRRLIQSQKTSLSVESLAEQVKILIRPLLPTGQCTIERIARYFACEKRTLQRHLREESDATYQQLLDEVRFETACFYLKESNLPVIQVAQLAGFSEPTNFARAFRQYFGTSPRQWRQAQDVRPQTPGNSRS
jgi:AraC-like DNA-binding protein